MRGFFGIGVQEVSKSGNIGNLIRSAHAFNASFFFTISPDIDIKEARTSDTSDAFDHLPYYEYESVADFNVPSGCQLIGIELTDEAIELPSFRHPLRAAYVLGPEMGSLSEDLQERCEFIIKIPTKFCINVAVAGALVMYDRKISMGRFADRPIKTGGPNIPMKEHKHGPRRVSKKKA
jgi:tRNA G18 (ribose-2'-O)-methylase SpoU